MGLAAFGAFNPANPEKMFSVREDDPPRVVTVDRKAGRMPAGASQLMKLEAVNNGFVIILRKLIVIFDRNEYHCLAWHGWRDSHVVVRQQADFARVVACCRFCDIDNDIIKRHCTE